MSRFFANAIPESAIKALLQICPRPDKPMPLIGDLVVPVQPQRPQQEATAAATPPSTLG